MSDPQRTIPRAPRTPRGRAAVGSLLVIAGGFVGAWTAGVLGGIAGGLVAYVGLCCWIVGHGREVARYEREMSARLESLSLELEERRRAETKLRAELRTQRASCEESEEGRRRAESADRAKTAFLSNLSRELRTPLNNVLGMAGILLDTRLSESQADYARTIHASAEALIAVVDDILDLSRLDDGDLSLDNREFEFSYCVEGVVDTFGGRAKERALAIVLELDPSIPAWLRGDRSRLRQVLIALLNRAVEHATGASVRLAVRLETSDAAHTTIAFEVGVPGDAKDGAKVELPGTPASVSMSLAANLVQLMGGSLALGPDGIAAAFRIRLQNSARHSGAAPGDASADLAGMRMLLISASKSCETAAEGTARGLGMELDVATTGTAGLELLRNHGAAGAVYAIVAIDTDLSDVSGGELVGILRASNDLRGIGCVLLQPSGASARADELSRQGFDAWLRKPLSETRMRTAILHATADPGSSAGRRARAPKPAAKDVETPLIGADVLLAEDNLVNQRVTTLLLERLGCRVTIAATGMQAIERVMAHDFDVILMDCLMPELNGFEATRAIRRLSDPGKNQIPIVALTADADEGHRRACLDAGMNAHLPKPVRASVLARVLQHWTGNPVATPKVTPMPDASPIDPEVLASLKELGGDDPSIFIELVDLFLADTPARLQALESAQQSGDSEGVAASAHALKSSCGNLGAMTLYEMFCDIESSGRDGDVDKIASLIPKVRNEFVRVENALRREASGESA